MTKEEQYRTFTTVFAAVETIVITTLAGFGTWMLTNFYLTGIEPIGNLVLTLWVTATVAIFCMNNADAWVQLEVENWKEKEGN